jgi:hypothetical protein
MKFKKEYIIIVFVILLLSTYLMIRNTDQTQYKLPLFKKLVVDEITNIEITRPDSMITLNKKADNWRLSPHGYLADKEKVTDIINNIKNFSLTALVSESKNYTMYELTDDKKITVKARAGDKRLCRKFEIGKSASSFQHTFVKIPGDHRVYHAKGNFRGNFDGDIDDFRDKTVLSFEQNNITQIQITRDRNSAIISQHKVPVESDPKTSETQTIWKKADGQTIDQKKIENFLADINRLKCDQYIYDRKKKDFTKALYLISLTGSQKKYTLSIFAKNNGDSQYPVVSSESDYPFMLSEYRVDDMINSFDKS